jgi:hypothetical protein
MYMVASVAMAYVRVAMILVRGVIVARRVLVCAVMKVRSHTLGRL